MIDYSTIPNITGTFPNVASTNVTAPGAQDGTPFYKPLVDDLWGARQALMNHAGLTPDAVTEADGASQQLTAIQMVAGNPGEVVLWQGNASDPSTLGVRLLPLNGQGVLVASYADLVTYCYVGDGNNPTAAAYYKATDAGGTSRSTSGSYFILPDLRGQFVRGLDTSGTIDPDGASRDIGDIQDDATEKHNHLIMEEGLSGTQYQSSTAVGPAYSGASVYMIYTTAIANAYWHASAIEIGTDISGSAPVTGVGKVDVETRATNSVGRWCIRY
jgi:hypothetical protein